MPRYFFHLHCAESAVPDFTGSELRDPDHAWEAAQATARDLMATQSGARSNWLSCHFEVTDEGGETVLEFPFSEALEVGHTPN